MNEPTAIVPHTIVSEVIGFRDAALAKMERAVALLAEGHALLDEAKALSEKAHQGTMFYFRRRDYEDAHKRLFVPFDASLSRQLFREHMDACVWMHLVEAVGIGTLMDKEAKDQLYEDLCGDGAGVPEATEANIYATFERLIRDAGLIFQRGLANAFSGLDRRFRSHDGFKIGSRIILTRLFDEWGYWNRYSRVTDTLKDVERVFAVLDGNRPDPRSLIAAIEETRGQGMRPRQGMCEGSYFKIRTFKNGNAHLWFARDDLVEKANQMLADYYGAVLADAVPSDSRPDLRSTSGALSKDLAFYPTPEAVVNEILRYVHVGSEIRALEPSAGTGNIVRGLLKAGAQQVDAIEVDAGRVAQLGLIRDRRLTIAQANFLQVHPRPIYDVIAMNPPFHGTHWMEHVTHAYDFLASGGVLVAVLPISAEFGETAKHEEFRRWAEERKAGGGWSLFHDLPAESFVESGTRISTVFVVLGRKRA